MDGGGRVHTRKNSCRGKLSEDQSGGAAVTSDYDGFGRISKILTRILKRESPGKLQVNTLTPRPKGDLA